MSVALTIPESNTTTTAAIPLRKKKGFINYIHNFRGLAIVFVVAGHLLMKWQDDSRTHLFLKMFWENGSVLFVFIAGYLFQHLSKKYEYKSYLVTKLKNVIMPYFIVSVPIIIYRLVTDDYPGYILSFSPGFMEWGTWKKIGFFILTGAHLQPLWFVPMITIFYVISPLLMYIDRHPRLYALLIIFIGLSFVAGREPFTDILKMCVHFLSVYVFGMFLSRYKDEYLEFAKRYWIPITLITILSLVVNYIYFDEYNGSLNYIQKMLFCCFFIYWLWRLDKYIPKVMGTLADLSFGIFFIHYYVLLVIKAVYEAVCHHPIPGNLVYWILYLALVLAGTIIFIRIAKRILKDNSRQFIGS